MCTGGCVQAGGVGERWNEASSSHPDAAKGSNAWREHPGTERLASSADGCEQSVVGEVTVGVEVEVEEKVEEKVEEESRSEAQEQASGGEVQRQSVRPGRSRSECHSAEVPGCSQQVRTAIKVRL